MFPKLTSKENYRIIIIICGSGLERNLFQKSSTKSYFKDVLFVIFFSTQRKVTV